MIESVNSLNSINRIVLPQEPSNATSEVQQPTDTIEISSQAQDQAQSSVVGGNGSGTPYP